GRVLSPHPSPLRRREGRGGDSAEDRGTRLSLAEIRPRVCASSGASVRRSVSSADAAGDGSEGCEFGLPAGASYPLSDVGACIPPRAERPNRFTNEHQKPSWRGEGGGVAPSTRSTLVTSKRHARSTGVFLGSPGVPRRTPSGGVFAGRMGS